MDIQSRIPSMSSEELVQLFEEFLAESERIAAESGRALAGEVIPLPDIPEGPEVDLLRREIIRRLSSL